MKYTTIPEISAIHNLGINSVRFQLNNNNVKPIVNEKWTINGFMGKPFKKEQAEKVISKFLTKIERIKTATRTPKEKLKRYTSEEVCKVLRTDLKSNLWNKQISSWNNEDWNEFIKLVEADGNV